MRSPEYCRQRLRSYAREQLALLEQNMAAWVRASETQLREQLAAEIRECSQRLCLLEQFCQTSGRDSDARQLQRHCVLLLREESDASGKQSEAADQEALLSAFFQCLSRLHGNAFGDRA